VVPAEELKAFRIGCPALEAVLEQGELGEVRQVPRLVAAGLSGVDAAGEHRQRLRVHGCVLVIGVSQPRKAVEDLSPGQKVQGSHDWVEAAEDVDGPVFAAVSVEDLP
jgi:hypothetical protein